VYFLSAIENQIAVLRKAFNSLFRMSYAVKANPNTSLIQYLNTKIDMLDVSSIGEFRKALEASWKPDHISFSGPSKSFDTLQEAIKGNCGLIVCESEDEIEDCSTIAQANNTSVRILIRINPLRSVRSFEINMGGKASQFGIDEEDLDSVLQKIKILQNITLDGFHTFTGTNSLDPKALIDNFSNCLDVFVHYTKKYSLFPTHYIFGTGFGIPYNTNDIALDIPTIGKTMTAMYLEKMKYFETPPICILEMGRYLVGEAGFYLTSVVRKKKSRGATICITNGGMHHHLSAYNAMGKLLPKKLPIHTIKDPLPSSTEKYRITGPLCTIMDTLALDVSLPSIIVGDTIAIGSSGAYGLTASPTHFISHNPPKEYLVIEKETNKEIEDISEIV
jgi:diaminopimelate decarboxylase